MAAASAASFCVLNALGFIAADDVRCAGDCNRRARVVRGVR
jgi:hypothetical protein